MKAKGYDTQVLTNFAVSAKIPREQRFCPFCPNLIEHELHFIFTCPIYKHLRKTYLEPSFPSVNSFRLLPHDAKFQILLSSLDTNISKFIALGLELRQFLVSKPKGND